MSKQSSTTLGVPLARDARLGVWALPVSAVLLFVGTLSHQPNWKTHMGDWSRYVTTPEFLASHLVCSILGAAIGVVGMVALGAVLASRGRPRAGLWAMVTGIFANVVASAAFGVAAFTQPAIGHDYLAGHTAQASLLARTAANGGWITATIITSGLLLAVSVVIAGVGVVRSGSLPRRAGIGFAVSAVLLVVGAIPDNGIQTVATVLMVAATAGIAMAANRRSALVPDASYAVVS